MQPSCLSLRVLAAPVVLGYSMYVEGSLGKPSQVHHQPSYHHVYSAPPRQRPSGAAYDDPKPLACSRITYAGKGINSTITYTVPEGWSVWQCLKERFPEWNDQDLVWSIKLMRFYMDRHPSLNYHDPDHIPAGYVFIGGGDGAGPSPIE